MRQNEAQDAAILKGLENEALCIDVDAEYALMEEVDSTSAAVVEAVNELAA